MAPTILTGMIALAAVALVSNQHLFGIDGKAVLCVPDADMDPLLVRYADESTSLKPGSGHTPGFGFLFHAEAVKSSIPQYAIVPGFVGHPYVNVLSGTVAFLSKADAARYGPAMYALNIEDEWYSRGACPQPSVERLSGSEFYKIKCAMKANYATIWNRGPEPGLNMPNPDQFVVATCDYNHIDLGPYNGKTLKNCRRVFVTDGFLIDYRIQEENIDVIPKIDVLMQNKLARWKDNCSSPI